MTEWSFIIPGPFPSVNHMYRPVLVGGHPRIAKVAGVENWQTAVSLIVKSARPSGWGSNGQIRLIYDFYLRHDADCDNLQKALNDAIASALGVNDACFLPCVRSKSLGAKANEVRVAITIQNANNE